VNMCTLPRPFKKSQKVFEEVYAKRRGKTLMLIP